MVLKVEIVDGKGGGNSVCTTKRGELVINKADYSEAYQVDLLTKDIAYNFIGPKSGKRFVISDIIFSTNKTVGANGAEVLIYESSEPASLIVSKSLFKLVMPGKASFGHALNMIVSEGVWVNITTDDDDVFATLMGFYVDA